MTQWVTMLTGARYPGWYPAMLAWTMMGRDLLCITDWEEGLWRGYGVDFLKVDEKDLLDGWWGKLNLFEPGKFILDDFIFVDVDSICVREPGEIEEWVEAAKGRGVKYAFARDHLNEKKISTALFWVGERRQEVWDRIAVELAGAGRRFAGDQDLVGKVMREGEYEFFPKHFQVAYKAIFGNEIWQEKSIYTEEEKKKAIFWTFNGRPDPDEVWTGKRPGWKHLTNVMERMRNEGVRI